MWEVLENFGQVGLFHSSTAGSSSGKPETGWMDSSDDNGLYLLKERKQTNEVGGAYIHMGVARGAAKRGVVRTRKILA